MEVIFHPRYDPNNYNEINYEIALIKLSEKVTFGKRIGIACLPKEPEDPKASKEPIPGTKVTTTGWGYLKEFSGTLSKTLMYVHVPIVNKLTCQLWYSAVHIIDFETMLCAGLKKGGKDSCAGDGGGNICSNNLLDFVFIRRDSI